MATKQQRKRLTEVLIDASLADTKDKMNLILVQNMNFFMNFSTNTIKKTKQDLINKAIENNMHIMASRLEKMFPFTKLDFGANLVGTMPLEQKTAVQQPASGGK